MEAKRAALNFVGETFTSVKSPQLEVERGFRFWDAVSGLFKNLPVQNADTS